VAFQEFLLIFSFKLCGLNPFWFKSPDSLGAKMLALDYFSGAFESLEV
jgi:hypothetical protein